MHQLMKSCLRIYLGFVSIFFSWADAQNSQGTVCACVLPLDPRPDSRMGVCALSTRGTESPDCSRELRPGKPPAPLCWWRKGQCRFWDVTARLGGAAGRRGGAARGSGMRRAVRRGRRDGATAAHIETAVAAP